jgi:hypothetical protein
MEKNNAAYLKAALRLTDVDIMNLRELEGSWDVKTEQFVPSMKSLRQLIRSTIENSMGLEKHRRRTAKKEKKQQN